MDVQFGIDAAEVGAMASFTARLSGQLDWISAKAMTASARASKAAIERDIHPRIEGGPTTWTKRGLLVRFAKPDDLTAVVGYNYGDGSFGPTFYGRGGTPAGRYMQLQAAGGDRRPKSTEKALRRAGVIAPGAFITPASGLKRNAQGNVPGSEYQRILSRVRAAETAGFTSNAPQGAGSRGRSGAKRRERDYFPFRQPGGNTEAIMIRTGPGPKGGTGKGSGKRGRPQTIGYRRGMQRALHVTEDAPNYEARLPIRSVAMAEYRRVFSSEFSRALRAELEHQARRSG